MRVRCLRQCDVRVPGRGVRALFPGQFYELDDVQARGLIRDGMVEARDAEATDKSVHGPYDRPKRVARDSA